jgi:hypothetical protein
MVASIDKKWDAAIAEFKTAIDGSGSPAYTAMVRLVSVYNNDKKYDDATALADKLIASGASDNLKKIAGEEKARAAKGKGQ